MDVFIGFLIVYLTWLVQKKYDVLLSSGEASLLTVKSFANLFSYWSPKVVDVSGNLTRESKQYFLDKANRFDVDLKELHQHKIRLKLLGYENLTRGLDVCDAALKKEYKKMIMLIDLSGSTGESTPKSKLPFQDLDVKDELLSLYAGLEESLCKELSVLSILWHMVSKQFVFWLIILSIACAIYFFVR